MDGIDPDADVFECESCGNVAIGTGDVRCCDGRMRPIEPAGGEFEEPSLEDLLRSVFGMSETELEVCLCVMEAGETTVKELASRIDYDRSNISRHLNHLVTLGVLERQRRLLEKGGHVYVYVPADTEDIRNSFRSQFLSWTSHGLHLIDGLRREKIEHIVESQSDDPEWRIFLEK